ncbi:MAG: hypothetical protein IMZ59_05080 [Actinobacteria bacterium]|nr:hypothetical protein [Actinomycetota bacterium]
MFNNLYSFQCINSMKVGTTTICEIYNGVCHARFKFPNRLLMLIGFKGKWICKEVKTW